MHAQRQKVSTVTEQSTPDSTRTAKISKGYRRYLLTRGLGDFSHHMLAVALGWQMYELTGRALDLGLVGLVQFIPALVLTIPAGQLLDLIDRRKMLAASLAMQVCSAAILCWASLEGWINRDLILLLCLAIGSARSIQLPAQQALIPMLVPNNYLAKAMAMNATVSKTATICGPAIGGFLYATGASVAYGTCASMLVLAFANLMYVSMPKKTPKRASSARVFDSMFAGIRFVAANRVVLGAMTLDMFAVVLGGVVALLPVFAKDVLHTGSVGFGLLRSAPAVGGVIISIWLARHPIDRKVGRSMFVAVAIYGISTALFSLSTNLHLSILLLVIVGAADLWSTVLRHSLVILSTPGELLGRVSAVHSTGIVASHQLGQFRAGAAAEFLGPIHAALFGALGTLAALAWCARAFPALFQRKTLHGE